MSTVVESPSSDKKNPDWSQQVKIGSGRTDAGAFHRAVDVASELFRSDVWDGRGLVVVEDPYETHRKMKLLGEPLVEGVDYHFGESSFFRWEVK